MIFHCLKGMEKVEKLKDIKQPLLLFDGVCNLCNGYVQFVIKRDPDSKFLFTPLQSQIGAEVLDAHQYQNDRLSSVLLLKNGKLYEQSDVALEMFKDLKGLWPLLSGLKIIPKFLRDGIYRWIARNRYNWFGKKDQCMIPTPELNARFLS